MANYETTTKMKVDISDLKNSMQEARKQVAYANSEFKAVSSSMDDWSKSSDGLSAKIKQLKSNLDSQEKVLEEYEKTLEKVKQEYGENSKEALEYATKLNNQKAVVNKTKKELDNYEDALVEVSKAEKIASKTGKDVAEVLDDVGKEADDAGEGFTVFKGAIATFVGNGLTALVGGLRDAATSILGLADSTREYRDQMAKLSSASSEAGYTSTYTANKYKELYGVLADDTATTTTISNFMAMGAEGKTLDSLLNSSIGIWSKYGDSIPLDGLAESINETSKVSKVTGNLADALNWAGINEDEFNAKLEKTTSEQERQELIAKTLEDAYGGLADTYKENNKSIIEANEAQADYNKVMGELGAKVEPITTGLKKGFTGVLKEAIKLFGGDVDVEAFTGKMEEGFGIITDKVLPAVKEGLGWIVKNKDAIIAGLAGIAAGFVAFQVAGMITTAVGAIKSFTAGLTLAEIAMKIFNTTVKANPIGLIVTAIGLLVAGFVYLWNTCEPFKQFWIDLWENFKNVVSVSVEAIGKFFTETIPAFFSGFIEWVKTNWQAILLFLINPFAGLFKYFYDNNAKFKEFVDNAITQIKELPPKVWIWLQNTIAKVTTWFGNMSSKAKETGIAFISRIIEYVSQLPSKIWTQLLNVITKVVQFATDLGNKAKEAGQNLVNNLINKAKELPGKIASIGGDVVAGLWNGMNDKIQWLKDKISGFVGDVTGWLKSKFEINSPSKLMEREIGQWLPEGIAVGINRKANTVKESLNKLVNDSVKGVRIDSSVLSSGGKTGGVVNNFYQTINSPKQLSRLEIYRQSKNLLGYAGGA